MLRALDAQLVAVAGTYDDSVDMCAAAARQHGWQLASDTSWNGDGEGAAHVMRGYTVLVEEALAQMDLPPTHVFVQGGVGGLAGAVAGYLADTLETARPMIVVVEPDRAGCLLASALAGRPVAVPADGPTAMAMLECYRPSETAWPILHRYVDAFMTIPDAAAIDAVRYLANPSGVDPVIAAGICGAAGMAGLVAGARLHAQLTIEIDNMYYVKLALILSLKWSSASRPSWRIRFQHQHIAFDAPAVQPR